MNSSDKLQLLPTRVMCKTNPSIALTLFENFHKGKSFTNQVDPNQLDREGLTRNLWCKNEGIKEASPNGL
jgi:hypothetical protein